MKNMCLFFLGIVCSSIAVADISEAIDARAPTWIGMLAAGPVWNSSGKTQTLFIAPQVENTYTASSSTQGFAVGEIFVGMQQQAAPKILTRLGLMLVTTGSASLSGMIWDNAEPIFANHSYQYHIQHSAVAVEGFVLLDNGYWMMPWVSASIGVGFNRAHGFQNISLIYEALPSTNFTNHTQTAFSYTLGVGGQKKVTDHWEMGIGYEFSDWGRSELGPTKGQTINTGLSLHHLYTNGFLLNVTYIA